MSILSAKVSQVPIGHSQVEGLLGADGRFYVGIPQLAASNFVPPNRSIKQLETLTGMAFSSHVKLKTDLNSKPVNAIPIELLEILIARLDRAGNIPAQNFRDALVGLSLHQLFCDAFGLIFEKEDRQQLLKDRMEAARLYRVASGCVSDWMANRTNSAPSFVYYTHLANAFNLCLFGKTSKQIREELKVKGLIRDNFGESALKAIVHLETTAVHLWKQDRSLPPHECVKKSADFLGLKPISYQD